MSLIHWWPLNGNTNDLGISPCTVSGTPAFAANGKIGKCLNSGTLTMPAAATAQAFNKDAVSVCFWLYNGGSGGCIFGTDPMTPPNNRRFTLFQYPTANDLHWSWQNEDSGGTFTSGVANGTIPSNAWTHICAVWDNGTARIYVNGAQVGTSTGTCTSTNWAYDTVIARPSSTRYYNDIRIYNHALSAKEVKEISKGLVLHYTFEDEYIEPTTNIDPARNNLNDNSASISNMGSSGNTTVSIVNFAGFKCYKIEINKDNISSWFGVYLNSNPISQGASVGDTVTRSVMMYVPSGQTLPGHFTESIEGNSKNKKYVQYDYSRPNTWQKVSLTGTIADTGSNNYLHYLCAVSSGSVHLTIYLRDFQMEIKDHATPYVNGTRSGELAYDSSGYGNNGTVNGNIQISSDSISGQHSVYSPAGANYIEKQGFPVGGFNADQQFTINAWIKIAGYIGSDWNTIFRLAANNAADTQMHLCYNSSGKIILSQYSDDPQYDTSVALNTWAMITWVHYKEGSTAKCKYYVNGQQIGDAKSYSGLINIQDNARLTLFYDSIRNAYGANLSIADFKIFATALSADDVKAEYNRKAAIDKKGNLFTGEIIETAGSATKIDKNSFIDSNLFATTMTLEDGSVWVPICIHYVPDGLFTGSSNTFYYAGRNIWENFGAINDLERPESNQWEFYIMQQSTVGGAFSKYRFKQNVSPLSATWEQVNPSKVGTNVTRISSSTSNNYAGMYWYNNSNVAMCFANGSNGNWYGCGIRAVYQGGIPGYNGETVKGWQLVYMRISKHKARMFKNGIVIPTDIIEN